MRIAFIGKMFSGKTTAANYLVQNENYKKLAFADPVKVVSAAMLNEFRRQLDLYTGPHWTYDLIQERKGEPQVRKLLQLVGTELGRELVGYENVWVDLLVTSATPYINVVVDDMRFPNEADGLRAEGFRIVRITRPEEDRMALLQQKYPDSWQSIDEHPSETSLDNYEPDAIIYAETVQELNDAVHSLVHRGAF